MAYQRTKFPVFTLRIDPELLARYKVLSSHSGMSLNAFLAAWLDASCEGATWMADAVASARVNPAKVMEKLMGLSHDLEAAGMSDILQSEGIGGPRKEPARTEDSLPWTDSPPLTNRGGSNPKTGGVDQTKHHGGFDAK